MSGRCPGGTTTNKLDDAFSRSACAPNGAECGLVSALVYAVLNAGSAAPDQLGSAHEAVPGLAVAQAAPDRAHEPGPFTTTGRRRGVAPTTWRGLPVPEPVPRPEVGRERAGLGPSAGCRRRERQVGWRPSRTSSRRGRRRLSEERPARAGRRPRRGPRSMSATGTERPASPRRTPTTTRPVASWPVVRRCPRSWLPWLQEPSCRACAGHRHRLLPVAARPARPGPRCGAGDVVGPRPVGDHHARRQHAGVEIASSRRTCSRSAGCSSTRSPAAPVQRIIVWTPWLSPRWPERS